MNAKTYWAIVDCCGERFEFCLGDCGQVDALIMQIDDHIHAHEPFSVSYEERDYEEKEEN